MGKARKKKARKKLAGREKGKRKGSPVLFSCLRFLNSADPTISEPGTGYEVYGRVEKSVILVGKKALKGFQMPFMAVKKSRKRSGFVLFSHFWGSTFTALERNGFILKGYLFLSKMVYIKKSVLGRDLGAEPPRIKICWTRGPPGVLFTIAELPMRFFWHLQ